MWPDNHNDDKSKIAHQRAFTAIPGQENPIECAIAHIFVGMSRRPKKLSIGCACGQIQGERRKFRAKEYSKAIQSSYRFFLENAFEHKMVSY